MTVGASGHVQLTEFTTWTFEALLASVFRRAADANVAMICTDDLLVGARHKSRLGAAYFGAVAQGVEMTSLEGEEEASPGGDSAGLTMHRYEAEATLREVAHAVMAVRRERPLSLPRWSDKVVVSLEEALRLAAANGLNAAGEAEVILGLLSVQQSRAAALLSRLGLNRAEIVGQLQAEPPLPQRPARAPAVDMLEMLGLLPTPGLVRVLTWPLRVAQRRLGPRSAALSVLEEEAGRQAVRVGASQVQLEHVVVAMTSVWHQLMVAGTKDPHGVWPDGEALQRGGIAYPRVTQRIAAGAFATRGHGLEKSSEQLIGQLRNSPEVDAFLESAKNFAGVTGAFLTETLLKTTGSRGPDIIGALGGDLTKLRQAVSTK